MRRTRAQALALVNWKGVFYERYLLDRHVTALEGANGAGKTTVMIAAYVVLLPDMTRLRFTNLGETGATGGDKGIWGRLGEPGRPSYAVLDFDLPDGRRFLAGVHLERKGEPSVEPTPFVVTGLAADVRLQEILLVPQGGGEGIPELPELRENAARLGGRLQVFHSARDYFAELFEAGVLPMRLSTDEERNKFNEMLRTSMTGGISRALTSELRSFLLKEEGGLAETLKRMMDNLAACKRTRGEVEEARRLEGEIRRVFEAGQTMFAAAFAASREAAEELRRKVAEAERLLAEAEDARANGETALARVRDEQSEATRRREELGTELASWREKAARLGAALAAAARVQEEREALAFHNEVTEAAARDRDEAVRQVERATAARDAARVEHRRAAAGLANFQEGLELLHRHAAAYAEFARRRTEAERLLRIGDLPLEALDGLLAEVRAALVVVDRERREAKVRLADADHDRAEFSRVLAAVGRLAGEPPDPAAAHETARSELRRFRERESIASRLPELTRDLDQAERLAVRQAEIRRRAGTLGLVPGDEPGSARLRALLEALELDRDRLEEAARNDREALVEVDRKLRDDEARLSELARREPIWHELAACTARLAEATSVDVADAAGLETARATIRDRESEAKGNVVSLRAEVARLHGEVRELLASGGPVPPELLALRDRLGAELLAASYEEVGIDEAGALEARLGPAVNALVVENIDDAVRSVADRPEALESVWLVGRKGDRALPRAAAVGACKDVVVDEGIAWRVSRIPARPRLGRKARERRAAELRREAEEAERRLGEAGAAWRTMRRLAEDGDRLLREQAIWLAGDPRPQIDGLRKDHADRQAEAVLLRGRIERAAEEARRLRGRLEELRSLLVEAALLDPPDHLQRAAELRERAEAAREAAAQVAATRDDARIVEEDLDLLKRPPLEDRALEELHRRVERLKEDRDRLDRAAEALAYLAGHLEARVWSDAAERLRKEGALRPDLEAQVAAAAAGEAAAEGELEGAEAAARKATADWQDADGRRRARVAALEEAEARFAALGIPSPTEEARRATEEQIGRLEAEDRALEARVRDLEREIGRAESELGQAAARWREASERLAADRRDAAPAIGRWERLEARVAEHGLLGSTRSPFLEAVRGSPHLQSEAAQRMAALIELLRAARGGEELAKRIEKDRELSESTFGDMVLEKWLAVRDWLRSRLPAQLAESDDPREGLERLADRLSSLEERLARQEKDLQGESGDVARGIDVRIRRAQGQVRRLNVGLAEVRFGSIHGIRVRFQREERMEQVLRALREGAVQGLLFEQDMPIEEALDSIFRRHVGGRSGGQRLLDYREYVQLKVEVRRGTGTDWEDANPTRLSTGEAIGVGAALMMVVLAEWEQDANLLRGKRSAGSLRFLFLDEANRLSHDNLGTLFDLCRSLDLQLLIAAPEVARAEGNTTYRLVRRILGEGREEVIVSGRRVRAEA